MEYIYSFIWKYISLDIFVLSSLEWNFQVYNCIRRLSTSNRKKDLTPIIAFRLSANKYKIYCAPITSIRVRSQRNHISISFSDNSDIEKHRQERFLHYSLPRADSLVSLRRIKSAPIASRALRDVTAVCVRKHTPKCHSRSHECPRESVSLRPVRELRHHSRRKQSMKTAKNACTRALAARDKKREKKKRKESALARYIRARARRALRNVWCTRRAIPDPTWPGLRFFYFGRGRSLDIPRTDVREPCDSTPIDGKCVTRERSISCRFYYLIVAYVTTSWPIDFPHQRRSRSRSRLHMCWRLRILYGLRIVFSCRSLQIIQFVRARAHHFLIPKSWTKYIVISRQMRCSRWENGRVLLSLFEKCVTFTSEKSKTIFWYAKQSCFVE